LHLKAMEQVAGAKIIKGETRKRTVKCKRCGCAMLCPECGGSDQFTEKMTDVKIALHILEDAIDDAFDRAYLVSRDLDLLPALEAALRRNDRVQIVVLFPPEGMILDEYKDLEGKHEQRVRCMPLDIRRMQRFPDDLPTRWHMELPKHWRADAGARPPFVGRNRTSASQVTPRTKGPTARSSSIKGQRMP
jgi:NYN domain